jgi:preprotein translocase subunit YajC
MKIKIDAPRLLLIAIALLLLFLWVTSCNPVKRVLNNQEMLEEVAKVVVKGGFCANDTTFITKSDTLVEVDTLVTVDVETHTEIVNDTVYFTKWKTRDITKSTTIHDTIKSFIVDNARVRLLQADSARLTGDVIQWKGKADSRLSWLISLLVIIALFIYLKLKK